MDLRGFDKEIQKFAKDLQKLPRGPKNPLVLWDFDYRKRTDKAGRPTVLRSGTFRGNRWKKLSKATLGNVRKGKGRKKSDGSRYKASDKILGKIRAQGMLGDWIQGQPILSKRNTVLIRRANKPYAGVHARGGGRVPKRAFHWGPKIQKVESKALTKHVAGYIGKQLKRRVKP